MPLTLPSKFGWHLETPIYVDQNPPTINVPVTIADLHGGIRGIYFKLFQSNTEAGAKDIDLEIIVDNVSFTRLLYNLSDSTLKYVCVVNLDDPWDEINLGSIEIDDACRFFGFRQLIGDSPTAVDDGSKFECHDLKITITLRTAVGAAQRLVSCLWYERKAII